MKELKILVIDDEEAIRNMLKRFFRGEGHEVFLASNGQEGLEIVKEKNEVLDLVIIDRIMPGGPPGEEVARAVKRDFPIIKVIFMTGEHEFGPVARAAGADEVFLKSFGLKEILQTINKLFGE